MTAQTISSPEPIVSMRLLQRSSTITSLMLVKHMVKKILTVRPEDYMSSVNVSKPFKFSTVGLESLGMVAGLLKNSSPGNDELLISILKEFFHSIRPVMLQMCNESLVQWIFSISLQKNNPFFKAGDRKKQSNYRPISVLCSSAKIIEKKCRFPIWKLLELKQYI